MGKVNQPFLAFNRGIISKLGLARIDVDRVALSAEEQTNWFPRLLGSMMLRPGLQYIGSTHENNKSIFVPFIFSATETALIELSNENVRFWIGDELLTRPSVSTVITNGTFNGDLSGWTDNDQAGATSEWVVGNYMQLVGTGLNAARRTQQVTVSPADQNIEHAVRIVINRGPVQFRIGSDPNSDDYISQITLGTGTHSLSFTPQGNFYINFYSILQRLTLVESIEIESAGIVVLPSPYTENNLPSVRWDQSLDVVYLACRGLQQRKILRSGTGTSWSIVLYQPEDGPVKIQNTSSISIEASGLTGNVTLNSNQALFNPGQVGGLFKLVSVGQNVSASITSDNTFSDYIIVTGVGVTRNFTIDISGDWPGPGALVSIERSFDEGTSWEVAITYDNNIVTTFYDGLDNQTAWYRIGIATGEYISGTANVGLSYSQGSITGYVRITSFSSPTSVQVEVLKSLGSTIATTKWSEGEWSDYRGWPSAVALAEGRLFFSGLAKIIGSISDAYESFNDEIEGDSGLISRDLGAGAISKTNWLISLYRLFCGCDTAVKTIKTTSFEEPMTPNNFRVVEPSTQSCANVNVAKLDKKAIFVQGAGTRVFEMTDNESGVDYIANELTKPCPEVGIPGVIRLAVQRQPETMVHCVLSDGRVAILIYDVLEKLQGWFFAETDGIVEDVVVLPGFGVIEDYVYYSIARTVNGATIRCLERYAFQLQCQGETLNRQADSFIIYEGAPTNVISGLSHLEGREVIVWADGIDYSPSSGPPDARVQKTYTVTGGQITLDVGVTVSNAIVGLPYSSFYKSSKLAYASPSPLGQPKKVNAIGMVLYNTHAQGLRYGRNATNLDNLPLVNPNTGKKTPANTMFAALDTKMFSFGGNWEIDSRICLAGQAPRPVTVLSCEIAITTNDKA